MEYKLRKLKAKDIACVTSILNKIDKSEIKELFQSEKVLFLFKNDSEDSRTEAGMQIGFGMMNIIIKNYEKCQEDLFSLLASMTDKNICEIEEMNLDEFAKLLFAAFSQSGVTDFFRGLLKSMP